MLKKIFLCVLCVFVLTNLSSSYIVEASNSSIINMGDISGDMTNFELIDITDVHNIKYMYERDGITFIVQESANDDFSEILTQIYKIDGEMSMLVEEFTTLINRNGDAMILEQFKDGNAIESREINLSSGSLENLVSPLSSSYNGYIYYDGTTGKYYTSWYYAYSHSGNTVVMQTTVTVIATILAGICSYTGDVVTGSLLLIAATIFDAGVDDIYYDQDIYHVHQITYPEKMYYGTPVGIRYDTDIYLDSNRNYFVGNYVDDWHDPDEWPTAITIN